MKDLQLYNTPHGRGWTFIVGEYRGKGAWRAHGKIFTHSQAHRQQFQNRSKADKNENRDCDHITFQSSQIDCKKDHPTVSINTVDPTLDKGFKLVKESHLLVLWYNTNEVSKAKLLPKEWG
jgi:hypothetical protein